MKKVKNLSDSEKLVYILDVLYKTSKDEQRKEVLFDVKKRLETKLGISDDSEE